MYSGKIHQKNVPELLVSFRSFVDPVWSIYILLHQVSAKIFETHETIATHGVLAKYTRTFAFGNSAW